MWLSWILFIFICLKICFTYLREGGRVKEGMNQEGSGRGAGRERQTSHCAPHDLILKKD